MKLLSFAKTALNDLKVSAERFPFSVICAALFFVFMLDNIYSWNLFKDAKEERIAAILVAGYFWFGGAKLYAESTKRSFATYAISSIAVFAAIALYIYNGRYGISVFNFIISGLLAFVTVAPFLKKNSTDSGFYNFNREMWMGFVYAALLSIAFCGSASIILVTLKELFGLDLGEKTYGVIWAFGSTFLAPYYALSWVSRDFESKEEAYLPKGLSFIFTFILIPFGIIYLIILYAYAAKILVQWQLPNGGLSYMICGFGAVGTLTQLAVYPARKTGGLIRFFHEYFCRAFLPLIALLFIAIGVRINEYGLTESRYAILMAGTWFAATTILYIIRKDEKTMKFGPAILSAMLLLASFGPWGAVSLSEKSQVSRLEKILTENKILVDGKIVRAKETIEFEARKSISSIIDYLAKTDKLDSIKPWFPEDSKIHTSSDRYSGYQIVEDLGIKYTSRWDSANSTSEYFNYGDYSATNVYDVTGYSHLITNFKQSYNYKNSDIEPKAQEYRLKDNNLLIRIDNKTEINVNLNELLAKLNAVPNSDPNKIKEMLFIVVDNDKVKAKILFHSISGYGKEKDAVNAVSFDLLYTKK